MHPGMVFISDLAVLTNTTSSTLKRFIASFTKETNTAVTILKALGVSYVVEGKGRNGKSYFLKT
jgi:TolB-like protein